MKYFARKKYISVKIREKGKKNGKLICEEQSVQKIGTQERVYCVKIEKQSYNLFKYDKPLNVPINFTIPFTYTTNCFHVLMGSHKQISEQSNQNKHFQQLGIWLKYVIDRFKIVEFWNCSFYSWEQWDSGMSIWLVPNYSIIE